MDVYNEADFPVDVWAELETVSTVYAGVDMEFSMVEILIYSTESQYGSLS